jgi:hypothetical protein
MAHCLSHSGQKWPTAAHATVRRWSRVNERSLTDFATYGMENDGACFGKTALKTYIKVFGGRDVKEPAIVAFRSWYRLLEPSHSIVLDW